MSLNSDEYNSFSQAKGLLWKDNFDGILSGNFLPPVGSVIDLTDACNLHCAFCNAASFRHKRMQGGDHVRKIVDMLADWGVHSVCYAGGGEPSLHPEFTDLVKYTHDKGLEVGISTNGVRLDETDCEIIAKNARFCGFSIDAATEELWRKIKGGTTEQYNQLMYNCEVIAAYASKTSLDLTYKFMLTPENQHEILKAAQKAMIIGFKNFFVRPAAYENVPEKERKYNFDIESVLWQLEKARELQDDRFHVYSNFRRVDEKLHRILPFKKCLATPLIVVFCADGYCYPCIDYRERQYGRMTQHRYIRRYWGSDIHKRFVNSLNLENCPRCAMGTYQRQIEAYQEDKFFQWFP